MAKICLGIYSLNASFQILMNLKLLHVLAVLVVGYGKREVVSDWVSCSGGESWQILMEIWGAIIVNEILTINDLSFIVMLTLLIEIMVANNSAFKIVFRRC